MNAPESSSTAAARLAACYWQAQPSVESVVSPIQPIGLLRGEPGSLPAATAHLGCGL